MFKHDDVDIQSNCKASSKPPLNLQCTAQAVMLYDLNQCGHSLDFRLRVYWMWEKRAVNFVDQKRKDS